MTMQYPLSYPSLVRTIDLPIASLAVSALLIPMWITPVAIALEDPRQHVQVTTTFSRKDSTGKVDVAESASFLMAIYSGDQDKLGFNAGDKSVDFRVSPTVGADGSVTLSMDARLDDMVDANTTHPVVLARPTKDSMRKKSAVPVFHSAIPADGLYSLEDIAGVRHWVKVGRVIDGWTIKAYDKKREILSISRQGRTEELALRKTISDGAAVTRGYTKVATVKFGESVKFSTPEGVDFEVRADLLSRP